jgi:hypothetical protein
MAPLDPAAVVIDAVDAAGSWARFRIDDPRRCLALLRELRQGDVALVLGAAQGAALPAVLWAVDEPQLRLHYSVQARDATAERLQGLLAAGELWAAAELGQAKLQWPVHGLHVDGQALAASLGGDSRLRLVSLLPTHLYALPQRTARRLRHRRHSGPQLRFRHPLAQEQVITLAALDISSGGCALWKPATVLPLAPGLQLADAELQLDARTLVYANLRVEHVTRASDDPESGARVGCSWQAMPASGAERLQQWLQAQGGRGDLLKLQL